MLWKSEFHDSPVFIVKADRSELKSFLAALSGDRPVLYSPTSVTFFFVYLSYTIEPKLGA